MCQCNFGVQDVSSLSRMCVFFCARFEDPHLHPSTPPRLQLHILLQLFREHVTAFWLYDISGLSEHHCFVLNCLFLPLLSILVIADVSASTHMKRLDRLGCHLASLTTSGSSFPPKEIVFPKLYNEFRLLIELSDKHE